MVGFLVGVEIVGSPSSVAATMATLPWMAPERIALDDDRSLVLLSTSFAEAEEARAYAERRVLKSASGIGLDLTILSSEAFPAVIDLRVSGGTAPSSDPRW
jgi:hypothetical protein